MATDGPESLAARGTGVVDAIDRHSRVWLSRRPQRALQVVDSHTAGNPTRILVDGVDVPEPALPLPRIVEWLRGEADWVRRRLNHEPRGGALTCSVLPLPPIDETHDLRAIFLEPGSYPPMCGHCTIGLALVAHELGLASGSTEIGGGVVYRILTPAGPVVATIHEGSPTVVSLENVDSYVVDAWPVTIDGRTVTCTLLYGGDYYPTLDARELGLELDLAHTGEIVRIARQLSEQFRGRHVVDPVTSRSADIYQVMFRAPSLSSTCIETTAVVAPPGVIDRSPCGTGSSALMALKVETGEVGPGQEVTTRSIIGSEFRLRAEAAGTVQGRQVVSPVVSGSAHITGFATIVADPSDPWSDGFPPL